MADTAKRTTNNNSTSTSSSSSKSRKSKNEVIRSALGIYLKQKNYSVSEKFRKSDLVLSQNNAQMEFSMMLDDDISKVNSFLYSNVLCLSNQNIVEQQFSKFYQFVQSQKENTLKNELQKLLSPVIGHLFIELLKGRDCQPALDFLKKHAHIIAPVDNLNTPLAHKVNGGAVCVPHVEDVLPFSTTQITFLRDSENRIPSQEYFKDLVQSMSLCSRMEDLDSFDITREFRYAKYEMELSVQSLFALKHFLIKNGHVLILHILNSWFSFEIIDIMNTEDADEEQMFADEPAFAGYASEEIESNTDLLAKIRMELGIESQPLLQSLPKENFIKIENIKVEDLTDENIISSQPTAKKRINHKLKSIRRSVIEMKAYEQPSRVLRVENTDNGMTSGDIDTNECHLACGFDDSTIKLWQMNSSNVRGRKPYSTFSQRSCEWSLENMSNSSSESDDEDDRIKMKLTKDWRSRSEQHEDFMSKRCTENIFTDSGGVALRGHSKGVTDVLFSKNHSLLLSTSKDNTMRAWKPINYTCAAVYRGHNYPVWCVAESPIGLYLATGSRDLTARLWSTDREIPLQTYIGHTQDIDAVAFHPNGNYLATGSTDLTVRLWCVTTGKLFRVFTDCHLPVQCISFSPDGKLLAAGGEESKIRIFDLAAGSQLSELKDHSAPVTSIVWDGSGQKLASCCADGSLRVFNLNAQSSSQNPSTSSSSAAATGSSHNKLISSLATGCKRSIKTYFNMNGTLTCIGSS